MKFLLSVFALFAVSCGSKPIRLDAVEQATLFSDPGMAGMLTIKAGEDLKHKFSKYRCESKESAKCWHYECLGKRSDLKCWKTEITRAEVDKYYAKRSLTADELKLSKEKCGSAQSRLKEKRRGCFDYLDQSDNSESRTDLLQAWTVFCQLDNTKCEENGKLIGKNKTWDAGGAGVDVHAGYRKIPEVGTDKKIELDFWLVD